MGETHWYILSYRHCVFTRNDPPECVCVCVCCRPASDPDRCDRGGETVDKSGHRWSRGPPQSAERRLAAVAAQGLKTLFIL